MYTDARQLRKPSLRQRTGYAKLRDDHLAEALAAFRLGRPGRMLIADAKLESSEMISRLAANFSRGIEMHRMLRASELEFVLNSEVESKCGKFVWEESILAAQRAWSPSLDAIKAYRHLLTPYLFRYL